MNHKKVQILDVTVRGDFVHIEPEVRTKKITLTPLNYRWNYITTTNNIKGVRIK